MKLRKRWRRARTPEQGDMFYTRTKKGRVVWWLALARFMGGGW